MFRLKRWITRIVVAAVALAPRVALADVATFSLEYEVDPTCPGEEAFIREITSRTSRARHVESGAASHHFRVTVHPSKGRSIGKIEIQEEDGTSSSRELDDSACEEVTSALALIAALTLDPQASLAPHVVPPPAAAPPSVAPRSEPPKLAPKPVTSIPELSHPEAPPASRFRGFGGLEVGSVFGLLPVPLPVGSAGVGLEKLDTASIRLALEYGLPTSVGVASKTARLDFLAGRVEGCAFELHAIGRLGIAPCVGLDAGRISGAGLVGGGIATPHAGTWPWVALLAAGQADVDLDRFVMRVEGGLLVPFYRETFHFDEPSVTIHRVDAVTGFVQAGVVVRFP